jgi:hypothetical protein
VPSWHRTFVEVSNVSFQDCKRGKVEARWMTGLGLSYLFLSAPIESQLSPQSVNLPTQ